MPLDDDELLLLLLLDEEELVLLDEEELALLVFVSGGAPQALMAAERMAIEQHCKEYLALFSVSFIVFSG